MLKLDHLVIVAPSLEAGAAHVRQQLGVDMMPGGKHPEMGTHNLLLRLSRAVFLEVIAVDPDAAPPDRCRWFGLDDAQAVGSAWDKGRRLRAWVAQTDDLDAVLACHGALLGEATRISRGNRAWSFALLPSRSLPAEGLSPAVIAWGNRGSPAAEMPDGGAKLLSFGVEHSDPARVRRLYATLGLVDPPEVRKGSSFAYWATIETPRGIKELR